LGGKALNLLRLSRIGMNVPPWYAIPVGTFRTAMAATDIAGDIRGLAATGLRPSPGFLADLRNRIRNVPLPPEMRTAIREATARVFRSNAWVAVRSSAEDEDGAGHSFAGLHDSFLFVRGEDAIVNAVRDVWASAFNDRAVAYRLERRLPVDGIAVAVIVQEMVDAAVSGVIFTANPVTGDVHEVVISALFGAGEGLVSQGFAADTYRVPKEGGDFVAELADKTERMEHDPERGGLRHAAIPDAQRRAACLPESLLRTLAADACRIESACGRPQDIEFCVDASNRVFHLQTRPVTTVAEYGPAAGNHLIWDNSNIVESYSGVTTPMTFSFIRRAYTIVYHCFSEVMGIPPETVRANRHTFENMLGLIRGQVYYNLLNWYRLVRLFPGFDYNKKFMESMMGVKEPVELRSESVAPGFRRKYFVELPRLVRLVARSVRNFRRIEELTAAFEADFHGHYERWAAMDFRAMEPHELMAIYREMEDRLLWNWKAPIINDFFVMIFYGALKKLCAKWCGDTEGSLQNDLICGEGRIESTKPPKMLIRLAAMAQRDPELRDRILGGDPARLVAEVPAEPRFRAFAEGLDEYVRLYGFRCMNELKLEEESLRDRRDFLYVVIRNYLALDKPEALDLAAIEEREQAIRRKAEVRAAGAIAGLRFGRIKGLVFRRVLRNARLGVRNRENMRFARTKIYGLLRELLRALGGRLVEEGILRTREDVFYLTLDECWDFVKGTAVTTNLAALAELRRREFDAYRTEHKRVPEDRFETYGMTYHKNLFRNAGRMQAPNADGVLRGTGCCPGVVEGPVKVLRSPKDDMKLAGEILVAERTDPGWVPLYPSVSGILIERGSILSHSAIVAREMGIPAIVGIPGLISRISPGQRVKMNGAAGTVEVIEDTTAASDRTASEQAPPERQG
jgi:pyruvate,water dikinase